MPVKQNLKEHFEDGKLDLSMLDLTEVPVKDIAAIPKATSLDLSNNRLTSIGRNVPSSLSYLVYLDLARNQLAELPENIGLLANLKHLDLYSNQLVSLPLSFGDLKALKWLDLKQNPLMPKLAQIAGPCLDSAQCTTAAKNVVELLAMMKKQVDAEKQKRQELRLKEIEESDKKAHELKKEQQIQKKKGKKAKKLEAERVKLLESMDSENKKSDTKCAHEENGKLDIKELDESAKKDEKSIVGKSDSKTNKVSGICRTLTKFIVISTLVIVLGLFILNLIEESYYKEVRKHIMRYKNIISAQLPKPVVLYFNKSYSTVRVYFWRYLKKLGKLSVSFIESLQDEDTFSVYLEPIKQCWQVLWIRVSDIYRTFLVSSQ